MELKEINDKGDKIELKIDSFIGSNISTRISFIITKEQLKTLIELAQTDVDITPIERAAKMLHD